MDIAKIMTLSAYNNSIGRASYHAAESLYLQSLDIYNHDADDKRKHGERAMVLRNLSDNYKAKRQHTLAAKYNTEALEVYENILREECYASDKAAVMQNLAINYRDMKDFEKAQEMFQRAMDVYSSIDQDHPKIKGIRNRLERAKTYSTQSSQDTNSTVSVDDDM